MGCVVNGWILLHKKIWDNPRFYKNPHALTVWVWLLTHCNQNGVVTCGRKQIAGECGVGESNVYRILKSFESSYFENEPLVNSQTNNRFSVITILKYKELQRKANNEMNNNVTTIEQQSNNNITLIKNKEERIKNSITNVIEPKAQYGNADVNTVMDSLYGYLQVKPVKVQAQRIAAQNLINRHGLQPTLYLIKYAIQAQQNNVYAYKISSMQDLWNKQNDLLVEIKKKKTNQITRI